MTTLRERAAAALATERERIAASDRARGLLDGQKLSAELERRFGIRVEATSRRITVDGITFEFRDDGSVYGRVCLVFVCPGCNGEFLTADLRDLIYLGQMLERPTSAQHTESVCNLRKTAMKGQKQSKRK